MGTTISFTWKLDFTGFSKLKLPDLPKKTNPELANPSPITPEAETHKITPEPENPPPEPVSISDSPMKMPENSMIDTSQALSPPHIPAQQPAAQTQMEAEPELAPKLEPTVYGCSNDKSAYIIECFRDIRRPNKYNIKGDLSQNIEILIKWVDHDECENSWRTVEQLTNPQAAIAMLDSLRQSVAVRSGRGGRCKIIQRARAFFLRLQDGLTGVDLANDIEANSRVDSDMSLVFIPKTRSRTRKSSIKDDLSPIKSTSVQGIFAKTLQDELTIASNSRKATTLDFWLSNKQIEPSNLQTRVASSRRLQCLKSLSESPPLSRQKEAAIAQVIQSESNPHLESMKKGPTAQSEQQFIKQDEQNTSVLGELKSCLCIKLDLKTRKAEKFLCSCDQQHRLNRVRRLGIWLPDLSTTPNTTHQPVFKFYFCSQTGLPAFVLQTTPHDNSDDPRRVHHLSAADLLKVHPQWAITAIESIDRYLAFLLLQTPDQLQSLANGQSTTAQETTH